LQISPTELSSAQAKVKDALIPLLTKYGITDFDPIRGAYTATPGNRLDAMLDTISIKVEKGTLSITNRLDGSVIGSADVADVRTMALDITKSPDSAVLTDIKEITERLETLCAAMNMGSSLTIDPLETLFVLDPYYGKSSGHTRAEDIASIVTIFGANGTNKSGRLKAIRNVRIVSDQTANYSGRGVAKAYLLNYDFLYENGTIVHGNNATFGKDVSDSLWKFIGDPDSANIGNNYGGYLTAIYINSGNNYGWPVLTGIYDGVLTVQPADVSGTWVGSFNSSSSGEIPCTLYFEKNQAGTTRGYIVSNKFSGEFESCIGIGNQLLCTALPIDETGVAFLSITKTDEGLTINNLDALWESRETLRLDSGTAVRFNPSTDSGLRGVWRGTATGSNGQSNPYGVVMVVADNVAEGTSKYVGGFFTTLPGVTGIFSMNHESWQFTIQGQSVWYGSGTLTVSGNPADTLSFAIADGQPGNSIEVTLTRTQ